MQEAQDAENAVEAALADVTAKRNDRDAKVAVLKTTTKLVVNGVIGSPTYGPDSDLYEAMGFVPTHKRNSGLTQRHNPPPAP